MAQRAVQAAATRLSRPALLAVSEDGLRWPVLYGTALRSTNARARCAITFFALWAFFSGACSAEREAYDLAVFSVQMHVHGSFSEGTGSIDWHTEQARALGVDVIWWSDHDWRIGSHKHPSRFGFDSPTEPIEKDETWVVRLRGRKEEGGKGFVPYQKDPQVHDNSATLEARCAFSGARGFRIHATSDAKDFESFTYRFRAAREKHIRPLAAGVTLRIAVLPEEISENARPIIEVALSEHAHGSDTHPLLRYSLDNSGGLAHRTGEIFEIPVPFSPGRWNQLVLPITQDAVRGFPEHRGQDNSARILSIGLEMRRGARGAACFDSLEIEQETDGEDTFARQAALLRQQAEQTPSVVQLQGAEISFYGGHLNELSVGTELLDYEALATAVDLDGSGYVQNEARFVHAVNESAVARAHNKAGLISCNHPLGVSFTSTPSQRTRSVAVTKIERNRCWGADLLEVGYRERGGFDLQDHLWLWDELGKRQIFMVGTGVSDSHGSAMGTWTDNPNNFVTWVYSRSARKADLIEGLQQGRAFFGDITLFDGTISLRTDSGASMGDILTTEAVMDSMEIEIAGVQPGDRVRFVQSGHVIEEFRADAHNFVHKRAVAISGPVTCVRVELYSGDLVAKAFSNPVCYVRNAPTHLSRSTTARLKTD